MTIDKLKENYEISIDENYTSENETVKEIMLKKYIGTDKDITVPSEIDGYNIVLRYNVFEDADIDNVIIEDGITTIPCNCFLNSRVKTVILPKSVEEIKKSAFLNCENLKSIDIRNVKKIDHSIFRFSGIEEIKFPDIEKIPPFVCCGCKDLRKVVFSPSTKEIGFNAFEDSGIENIDLENIKILGLKAFNKCEFLKTVECLNVEWIKDSAFAYCDSLTNLNFPKLNSINLYAFANSKINRIIIQSQININKPVFANCIIDELLFYKNTSLDNCFFNTNIKQLHLYGDKNEINFTGHQNIKINKLMIFKNAKIYTNSLNNSYIPSIEVLGDLELIKNDERGNFENIIFNFYNKQNFEMLDSIKYNEITNFDELFERGFSTQQINQILKAQDEYDLLLSGVNPAISLGIIKDMIKINSLDKYAINKMKLTACNKNIEPLDYEIRVNKEISDFYNSRFPSSDKGEEYDDR